MKTGRRFGNGNSTKEIAAKISPAAVSYLSGWTGRSVRPKRVLCFCAVEAMQERRDFEQIVRRFELPLLQYAARIVRDRDTARDVVQDTFLKFQRNGDVPQDKTATWLFTVCRNCALNVCRKEQRLVFVEDQTLDAPAAEQVMPYERMEQGEARSFLLKIVATLPPRQQEVLQLKFQNDLSYEQIAAITRTTANSVGVLIHVALKTLRRRYAEASKDFVPFTTKSSS